MMPLHPTTKKHSGCCSGTLCECSHSARKPNDVRLEYLKVDPETPLPHYMFWPGNNSFGCGGKIVNGYVMKIFVINFD